MTKAIIIGNGSIGTELKRQIEEEMKKFRWSIGHVFSIDKVLNADGHPVDDISNWKKYAVENGEEETVAFLAIPTDNGKTAFDYISYFAEKNIPVVTCEKGSLAGYFQELLPSINSGKLGISATVGGGTRVLSYLSGRTQNGVITGQIDFIIGVLNGTLNYIFSRLSAGESREAVLKDVLEKRYAEPGAVTFEAIIRGETGDLHKKGIILANLSSLFGHPLKLSDSMQIDNEILARALDKPKEHRFLVVISKTKRDDFLTGVHYEQNEWHLQIGLFNTVNIVSQLVLPEGVNNALYINEKGNLFTVSGPGAGPEPTARAMIIDALELLKKGQLNKFQ